MRNIKSIDPKVTMDISFEEFGDAMHQAEGAMLAAYEFNGNKSEKNRRFTPTVSFTQEQTLARWNSGIITANGICD